MKRKTREEKAITLIALIITIVVLLILAVVAINAVTGDGIIQHATNARSEYEKAQDDEDDMLAYYEGVLQSGQVVPTVEQLQEKYSSSFTYFSSLKRAIENVNETENTAPDVEKDNAANAVAGIYEDGGNKYVVLMKDTEENDVLNVNKDVTINLGGKTLSFTSCAAYFNFAEETTAIIDGRLGGSTIQKNMEDETYSSVIYLVYSTGDNLAIESGKYLVNGKYAATIQPIRTNSTSTESININNINIEVKNKSEISNNRQIRGVHLTAQKITINNTKVNIDCYRDQAIGISLKSNTIINNSSVHVFSELNTTRGVGIYEGAEVTINQTSIFADASDSNNETIHSIGISNEKGTVIFNSGNVTGTLCGLYAFENTKNYIYGGTFEGCGRGGVILYHGENGTAYIENATITNGEYKGEFDFDRFTNKKVQAMVISKGNAYIENCNITGENKSIVLSNLATSENKLYISNSRVTGAIQVDTNQYLYLGTGMNNVPDTQITSSGTVDRTTYANVSFKGMDKTLMEQN